MTETQYTNTSAYFSMDIMGIFHRYPYRNV